jgi:hypothetical protein
MLGEADKTPLQRQKQQKLENIIEIFKFLHVSDYSSTPANTIIL